MNCPIRWRPLPMHQISGNARPGSNVCRSQSASKHSDHFAHFVRMRGDHGIVAGLGKVLGLPVQRLDEGGLIVDHHRLLVGHFEGGIAVDHLDAGVRQQLAGLIVLFLAAAARRIQHDPHFHAAPVRRDHRVQQLRDRRTETS